MLRRWFRQRDSVLGNRDLGEEFLAVIHASDGGGTETRASTDGGKIDEASMAALRGGWYLGKESFRDKLLGLMDKAIKAIKAKLGGTHKKASHAGGAVRAHNENEAERILGVLGAALDLPLLREELSLLKKSDRRKVICAAVPKGRTTVSNDWLAERFKKSRTP